MLSLGRITAFKFYVLDERETVADACAKLVVRDTAKAGRPVNGGPNDLHMGTTEHTLVCSTCLNPKARCDGHPGALHARYPVKAPLFRTQLFRWLKICCVQCGALRLPDAQLPFHVLPENRLQEIARLVHAQKDRHCATCGFRQPMLTVNKFEKHKFEALFDGDRESRELFNHEIFEIMSRVSLETVAKVGRSPDAHPARFVQWVLKVGPNTIRPEIRNFGTGRNVSNDNTVSLKSLVESNSRLPLVPPPISQIDRRLAVDYGMFDMLFHYSVRGNTGGANAVKLETTMRKQSTAILNRFIKKTGRVRHDLLSKRCVFMVRSTITGSVHLHIDEVGLPIGVATTIFIPEAVQPFNRLRLLAHFNNGATYPGCVGLVRKDDGNTYKHEYIAKDYVPKDGDVVLRHLVDGDVVDFNRQPTLTFTSISQHRVRVLRDADSIQMNVSACNLYHADFDGDAMLIIISTSVAARNEIALCHNVGQWMISYEDNNPMLGTTQDATVGISRVTRTAVRCDKLHAMDMLSHVDLAQLPKARFGGVRPTGYSGRELVSMLLPKINIAGRTSKFFMKQYASIFKYDQADTHVNIVQGTLTSGVLDKNTTGEGVNGSIFHLIHLKFGWKLAIEAIFNIQQLVNAFFKFSGFTTGLADVVVSAHAKTQIEYCRHKITCKAQELSTQLHARELVAPIGMTLIEYYEQLQIAALQTGEDFIGAIYPDVDLDKNGLANMAFSGAKGKPDNLMSMNSNIGQMIIGQGRPPERFAARRSTPYFMRYDPQPLARGYVASSYMGGIDPQSYAFLAMDARQGYVVQQMTMGIAGFANRNNIKCMESVVVLNLRATGKWNRTIQVLYAATGVDPRRLRIVVFPTIMLTDAELVAGFRSEAKTFSSSGKTSTAPKKGVQAAAFEDLLQREFAQIEDDRAKMRAALFSASIERLGKAAVDNKHFSPVDVDQVVLDVLSEMRELDVADQPIDNRAAAEEALAMIARFCAALPKVYFHEQFRGPFPAYIEDACFMVRALVRGNLCLAQMRRKNIGLRALAAILEKLRTTYKLSLIAPGLAVGIIAAQCISHIMQQSILDSKHRVGMISGGPAKASQLDKMREILSVPPTAKNKGPTMTLIPAGALRFDKAATVAIGHRIEEMRLGRFVAVSEVFFEEYGKPVHPDTAHERTMIAQFERYSPSAVVPSNLSNWVWRWVLDREEMLVNQMDCSTIVVRLQRTYPTAWVVYTPENVDGDVVIRVYLSHGMLSSKSSLSQEAQAIAQMKAARETIVRGVSGITHVRVFETSQGAVDGLGAAVNQKIWAIETSGSNTAEILKLGDIDHLQSQTDVIAELTEFAGIAAGRNKIVAELQKAMNLPTAYHATVYADEMTSTGAVTPMRPSGLVAREPENVCLHMSFQSQIKAVEHAASNAVEDRLHGLSASMVAGQPVRIGTQFNQVCVNEAFVAKLHDVKAIVKELDEL